jgi:hypothetical protein
MQPGDKAAVSVCSVAAPGKHPVIYATAPLHPVGQGKVTVEKKHDGYHIDLCNVPGVRLKRKVAYGGKVFRAKSVSGLDCLNG